MKEKIIVKLNNVPTEIKVGSKILLHQMNDNGELPNVPIYQVPSGSIMTVEYIDDANQLHGTYYNVHSSLAIIPEVDDIEVIG